MLNETGKVLAKDDAFIWVETIKQSTCSSCAAEKGCGQSLLAKIGLDKRRHTAIPIELAGDKGLVTGLEVGDQVTLSIEDDAVVKATLVVYLLPLITLLLAAVSGNMLALSEPALIGLSALGLLFGFGLVRIHAFVRSHQATYLPKITEKHFPTHISTVSVN